MDELFGLSTLTLMWIVLGITAVAASVVVFIYVRRPLLVKMGLRNIPRRRAQTVLVTLGLTLATIIVTTAFSTGDSLSTSIRTLALEGLVRIDHLVEVEEYAQGAEGVADGVPHDVLDDLKQYIEADPQLDAAVEAVFGASIELAVSSNEETGQLEPEFNLVGVDAAVVDRLNAVIDRNGDVLQLSELGEDEIVINELAARELAVEPGGEIQLEIRGEKSDFTVAAVAQNATLSGDIGSTSGGVLGIERFGELFAGIHEPGVWSIGAVAAAGGVEGGLESSDMLDEALQAFVLNQAGSDPARYRFEGQPLYGSTPIKADSLELADLISSIFTTLFLFMGSFSVVAGILLVFLIFAMLAEERKPEMGIARAVGMQRGHLIQTFMAEGMLYNIGAAAVGVVLGMLIALGMITVLNSLFSSFGFSMTWSITYKSLIISAGLGLVITFITVVFSSFRASRLNIVAAIRDLPESRYEEPQPWTLRRVARNIAGLFTTPLGLLLIPTTLVTLPIFLPAALLAQRNAERSARSLAPRLMLFAWRLMQWNPQWWFTFTVGGAALMYLVVGLEETDSLLVYMLGVSILPLGVVMGLTRLRFMPSRLWYTLGSGFLLFIWFSPFRWHEELWDTTLDGGPEIFVLSGAMLTAGGTLFVVFNLDLLVGIIRRLGGGSGRMAPIVRTAAAYPAASRYRTGLTIAMIALITFALVNFTTINASFQREFTTDEALGGYEVIVIDTDATNIGDLRGALETAAADEVLADIDEFGAIAVGPVQGTPVRALEWEEWDSFLEEPVLDSRGQPIINRPASEESEAAEESEDSELPEIQAVGVAADDREYAVVGGVDAGFVAGQEIGFMARSRDYDSDEAVWDALRRGEPVAVGTSEVLQDGIGFGVGNDPWVIPGNISEDSTILPRMTIEVGISGASVEVELIAVINFTVGATRLAGDDSALPSLLLPADVAALTISDPLYTRHYVAVSDGVDSIEVAQGIERTLRVQTLDVQGELEDQQALQSGFLALFQAFIGIGLVAGLAALGVIAVRAVVERRQQIGMMRAIGFQSRMVGLELLLEMGFIALLGLGLGTALALGMAYSLFAEGVFGDDVSMIVPLGTVLPILFGALGASLLLSFIPARQAANITIAEALRYE